MTNSRRIAGLLGPTLIAIAVSEWINLDLMLRNPAPVVLVYLNGTLLLVAGLSIVRAHSRWNGGWSALVTLMGWLAILGGLFRMFIPGFTQQHEQDTTAIRAVLVGLFGIGTFLTFKAYMREAKTAIPTRRERDLQTPVTR